MRVEFWDVFQGESQHRIEIDGSEVQAPKGKDAQII